MKTPRISASSYSNTAPLVWSFLYGREHGKVELVLDNAPSRSAELLAQDRVDAALVPVIASQIIDGVRIVPDVCVGASRTVRSVCLVTRGQELTEVSTVALDVSSLTSSALVRIIFKEFLGVEPAFEPAEPELEKMLSRSDAALLIGDPALKAASNAQTGYRVFDLAGLWHQFTGLGFVFAVWMTRRDSVPVDLAAARDEGLNRTHEIAANYARDLGLEASEIVEYLTTNISYSVDEKMREGMELYLKLAAKHGLTAGYIEPTFT